MSLATLERLVAPRRHPLTSAPTRHLNPLQDAAHQQRRDSVGCPLCSVICDVDGITARRLVRLPSFFRKQMAQEVIVNDIKVVYKESLR